MNEIGLASRNNTILIPHSPSSVNELAEQLRNSFIIGGAVTGSHAADAERKPS